MSEALIWGDARESIEHSFAGQVPYDEHDEQLVMNAWQRNPHRVMAEVERLAAKQQRGEITFPWRVLSKIAPSIISRVDQNARADVDAEKARAQRRSLSWVRNAGLHFDRWQDVFDEVFGERGNLRLWREDEAVVQAVRDCWEEVRPEGVRLQEEVELRAHRHRQAHEPVPPAP